MDILDPLTRENLEIKLIDLIKISFKVNLNRKLSASFDENRNFL